jgi:S-adenosylmethionine decarboxylase
MFAANKSSGKHMICDLKNIRNDTLLNSPEGLKNILVTICKQFDFKILSEMEHTFYPQGFTVMFLLSESHISIHTFPEKNYLAFDIYTCREYKDDSDYLKIYFYLMEQLNASNQSTYKIIERKF